MQDGYESTAGWSFGTSPSLSLDTTYVKEGEYSLKWINHVCPPLPSAFYLLAPFFNTKIQPAGAQFSKANVITDWSSSAYLSWWMYNVVPNNALLTLVLYSENVTSSGGDYYYYRYDKRRERKEILTTALHLPLPLPLTNSSNNRITLNWTGWKLFNVSRSSFPPSRSPVVSPLFLPFPFSILLLYRLSFRFFTLPPFVFN